MATKKTTEAAADKPAKKPAAAKAAAGAVAAKKPAAPRKKAAGADVAEKAAAVTAPVASPVAAAMPDADRIVELAPAKITLTAADLASLSEAITLAEGKYVFARGRRKTATASVKMWMGGKGEVTTNGKAFDEHFKLQTLRDSVISPLKAVGLDKTVRLEIRLSGGGMTGQAEAGRHGVARAIVALNEAYRVPMRRLGYLTRDPRAKERKKYGLKKARKAPQWSKR
jgi:small subunit ribosomal protein S9